MSKFAHDDVLDAMLDYVADNGDKLFICSAQPANYTEASDTYCLASHNLTVEAGNGDFAISNGDTNGRKLVIAEQAGISVTATGSATHIAICDSNNTKVLWVTTCNSQSLTSGNTVTVPTFKGEISDPT